MNINMITVFHGTNANIKDGLASGSFFTQDRSIAEKYGDTIYSITYHADFFCRDIFHEHWISRGFIPLDKLERINYGK